MPAEQEQQLYEQGTDLRILLALAEHTRLKTFIDVGAEKGSVARALFGLGFTGTLFEPLPGHLPALEQLVAGRQNTKVLTCAIDDSDHEGTLHIATGADGAPLDYFHSLNRLEEHPLVKHSKALQIPCRSLASLAGEGVLPFEIGVLKIDTEGNDVKVIQGMGAMNAEVLVCEFLTPSLYSGWSSSFPEALVQAGLARGFEECIAVKRYLGHEIVSLRSGAFLDGQWGNLIFTSTALFARAAGEIERIALAAEKRLYDALELAQKGLREKQAVIEGFKKAGGPAK